MFGKKSCKKCNKKVNKDSSFCPYCGTYISPYKYNKNSKKENKKSYGMLGKNDNLSQENNPFQNPAFPGFSGKIISKLFDSTMKMLEKEMEKSMKESGAFHQDKNMNSNTRFELYINGKKVDPSKIKITQKPLQQKSIQQNQTQNKSGKSFSPENSKKFAQLPLKEPKTNLRRLSDKIIYEIYVPGVKKIENISIVRAGNSVEVKAISDKNAYFKIIPFGMDILKYDLNNETIILELGE